MAMPDLTLIIRSTVQAVILSSISNIIAQLLVIHKDNLPFHLDYSQTARFASFSILACPPNVLWQVFLESRFPAYTTTTTSSSSSISHSNGKGSIITERRLNKRNTATKILLDQTLGAAVNTLAFLVGMALLRGDPETLNALFRRALSELWPLMRAGQRMWPLVSLISFTLLPLRWRTGFGGLAGIVWGVYLSLVEGRRPSAASHSSSGRKLP